MKWYTCFFLFLQVFAQPMSVCVSGQEGALDMFISSRVCTLGATAIALVGAGRYMVRRSPRARSWLCYVWYKFMAGFEHAYDAVAAISSRDSYFLRHLLSSGMVDLNEQAGIGKETLLYHAVRCRFTNGVRLLLGHGSDVNRGKELFGQTPLHKAAEIGHEASIAQLLAYQADVAALDNLGYAPLHHAVWSENVGAVRLLLDAGADVNVCDGHCARTPLHEAACRGSESVAYLLLTRRAKINAVTNTRETALHIAITMGHERIARALIESGARIDVADDDGKTALHAAARRGSVSMVRYLLARGAEIDRRTRKQETALHIVVALGHDYEGVACVLIRAGAHTKCIEGALQSKPDLKKVVDEAIRERTSAVDALARGCRKPIPRDIARLIVQVGQTGMPPSYK